MHGPALVQCRTVAACRQEYISSSCTHAGGDEEDTKDRSKQKACLERYRRACWEILAVLHKTAPQVVMLALHARPLQALR